MKKTTQKFTFTSLLIVFFLINILQAQSPRLLNYQGKLTHQNGANASGTYDMTFSIYADATGTNPLWIEKHYNIAVKNGIFNVLLGGSSPLSLDLFTGTSPRYLGIKVGNDDEMTPRMLLGMVPFAMQALTVPEGSITKAKLASDINLGLTETAGEYTASLVVFEGTNPNIIPKSITLKYRQIGSIVFVSMPLLELSITGNPKRLDISLPFAPAIPDQGGSGNITFFGGCPAGVIVSNAISFRDFGNGFVSGPFRGGFWYIAQP